MQLDLSVDSFYGRVMQVSQSRIELNRARKTWQVDRYECLQHLKADLDSTIRITILRMSSERGTPLLYRLSD